MEWNRLETIALANPTCTYCTGLGVRRGRGGKEQHACHCVYRAIFKSCYLRFRECATMGKYVTTVNLEWTNGPIGKRVYGRKIEEYMADFCAVSRRTLSEEDYRLFRYHYVLGADSKMCSRFLKMEKGEFFHRVYRIEEILGRTFLELKPYALFPLYEYFGPASEAMFGDGFAFRHRTVKRQLKAAELQMIA